MALLGYLYGITSERRLSEELRLHLAFMWFVGYDLDERTPDHSMLSKARRRFGVRAAQQPAYKRLQNVRQQPTAKNQAEHRREQSEQLP